MPFIKWTRDVFKLNHGQMPLRIIQQNFRHRLTEFVTHSMELFSRRR